MRGEDKCRYLCADKEEDMLKIFAWIIKAKVCFEFFNVLLIPLYVHVC